MKDMFPKKIWDSLRMKALHLFVTVLAFLSNANPANVQAAHRLIDDKRGKVNIGAIIGLVLGITLAAYMLPDAITALTNSSAYGATVPTAVVTLMTTVAGIVVAAVFMLMLYKQARS